MSATLPAPRRVDIASIRERFDLTQGDIANELHVDKRTVRRWERGEASPSPMAMAHIRRLQRQLAAERADADTTGGERPMSKSMGTGADAATLPQRRLPSL